MNGVSRASSAAVIFSPAAAAIFLCQKVVYRKLFRNFRIKASLKYIAQSVRRVAVKLVTRINIPVRSNRHVFVSCAAADQSLGFARSVINIDHKMKEIKPLIRLSALVILLDKLIVFIDKLRYIALFKRQSVRFRQYDRLYGNLIKTAIV